MTKTETEIVENVKRVNEQGCLCRLGVDPYEPAFIHRVNRFVKRLYDSGEIVWVTWTNKHGAGWATSANLHRFQS